jgi:ADP-ribose pyrophosphatase YjhB (NUDIX family)
MRRKELVAPKEIEERKIYGVVAVIQSLDGRILLVQETEDKPEYDKQVGDLSNPTETIEEGETIAKTLARLLEEEVGICEGMVFDLKKDWIGDYRIAGTEYWGRAFLVHYQGDSNSLVDFNTKADVTNPHWVEPEEIKNISRRAGVLEVVEDFLRGRRGMVRAECSPGFRPE